MSGAVRVHGAAIPTTLRRHGQGDGPPVLLVPGLSAGAFGFYAAKERSLAGTLADAGRTVWSVELAYSATSKTRQDFDAVVDSVERAIDILDRRGGSDHELDAVGHSLGGHIMLALAAQGSAPLRRLVTIATALDYRLGGSTWKSLAPFAKLGQVESRQRRTAGTGVPVELLSTLTWPLFGRAVPMPFQDNNFHPGSTKGSLIRAVVAAGMRDIPMPLLASLAGLVLDEGILWGDPPRSLNEAVTKLALPVMMVAGRQDKQCPLEAVRDAARRIPGVELLEVGTDGRGTGYGHYDVITGRRAREQVFARIGEFLGR